MDCRTFRDRHTLYIDDCCSELDALEMRSHARDCRACGRYDTAVRRGILVMRNLPRIAPSARFVAGLRARLLAEQGSTPSRETRWGQVAAYASLAATLAAVSLVAARHMGEGPSLYRLPPVVATAPPSVPSPFGTPSLVATVPTGMTIWPAIVMASHAPAHLMATELASER